MAEIAMGDITESRAAGDRRGVLAGASAALVVLARRWIKARRDRTALRAMDARARRDIGVTAGEVRLASSTPWWRWPLN